jgi:hypothetical protein
MAVSTPDGIMGIFIDNNTSGCTNGPAVDSTSNRNEYQEYFLCVCVCVCVCGGGVNPLNTELNPICHLQALLGGATIVVIGRLRVKMADA